MSGESEAWVAEEFPFAVSWQLRRLRRQLRWTLAEAVGRFPSPMSESQLHRVESGVRPLRLRHLWEISTTYGQTVVKVITNAAGSLGLTSPTPCSACKGTGLASRPPEPQWVQPPPITLHPPGFHTERSQP